MSRFACITLFAIALVGLGATVSTSAETAADPAAAAVEALAPVAEATAPELPSSTDATVDEAPVQKQDLETLRAEIFQAGWPPFGGGDCNQTTCGSGQFCCNYSCSICAPFGSACTDVYCPPAF